MFVSYPYNITILGLGEFEDLYYAACAKLKELLQGVDILLTNGFKQVHDTYFAYHNEPLHILGPISIGIFKHSLLIHQSILYSRELRSLLNRGVIEKNSLGGKLSRNHEMSPWYGATQHGAQSDIWEGTEAHLSTKNQEFKQLSRWRSDVEGLQDTSNMSCGMVFGGLAEKYRPMAMSAELEASIINRKSTPEAPQAFQGDLLTRRYISPYNLDERAKKLNVPGGPEMPCICDPECICAPLCASEPTENCLCEENGLFVRVTEGMDIDDLDVPDLVRYNRHISEASESSAASLNSSDGLPSQWPIPEPVDIDMVTPSIDQYPILHEVEKQIRDQKTQASDNVAVPGARINTASSFDDILSMGDILALAEENDGLFWQNRLSMPLLRMSDFTQHELTQPFAKQCDHPPKRQSVTERIFKTKTSSIAAHKNNVANDQPTQQGHTTNGRFSRSVKQKNKRLLADISFTGLRFTRRGGSRSLGA